MDIMLVVGDPAILTTDDTWVKDRLETTLGHTVTLVDDNAGLTDTSMYDLIVAAPSASNSDFRGDYDSHATPVLSVSATPVPHLDVQANSFTSNGSAATDIWVNAHPITAGITPGVNTIYAVGVTRYYYATSVISPGVTVFAADAGSQTYGMGGAADVGDALYSGALATKRIAWLPLFSPSTTNATGTLMFDQAVAWTGDAGPVAPVVNVTESSVVTLDASTSTGTAPLSYGFSQVSGPTVTLTPSGSTVSFTAPDPWTEDIVIAVTVTGDDTGTTTENYTVSAPTSGGTTTVSDWLMYDGAAWG